MKPIDKALAAEHAAWIEAEGVIRNLGAKLNEALAAKEQAEAERDKAEEEASKLWMALFWLDNLEPELTAAVDIKFGLELAKAFGLASVRGALTNPRTHSLTVRTLEATKKLRAEALAAKERAEAERNKALRELGGLLQSGHKAEGEVIRLTAALADAREECAKIAETCQMHFPHNTVSDTRRCIAAAIRSRPTTEPAKAEEQR